VAFAGDEDGDYDIYIQRLDGRRAINLTADSAADDRQPAYSPDGTQIAFRSERLGGGIFLMGATGESVRRLTDFGHHPSWSPDGSSLVISTEEVMRPDQRFSTSELWIVDVATGETHQLSPGDAIQPAWSPHGYRIAYWGLSPEGSQRDLWTVPVGGGEPVAVTMDHPIDWCPAWSADGSMLYFLSDRGGSMNVWRVGIDERTGRTRGEPQALTTPTRQAAFLAISSDGTGFAYVDLDRRGNIWRAPFDPVRGEVTGALEPVTTGSHDYGNVHPSPDGAQVAFVDWGVQQDVLIANADGSGLRRLTDDPYRDRFPRWSPDGTRLLFYSDRGGNYEVWTIDADGSGLKRQTDARGGPVLYPVWSPDGGRVAMLVRGVGDVVFRPDVPWEEQDRQPLPDLGDGWFGPKDWSPDGRRLVGGRGLPDGSTAGILAYSLESGEYEVLRASGTEPRWLPDSRRVIFVEDGAVMLLDRVSGEVRSVLAAPPDGSFISADVAAGGGTLFVGTRATTSDLWRADFSGNVKGSGSESGDSARR
jgi:Tol biopolymer transport system component